ncbi:PAS domain S-box protein [Anaerolineales bacterium HSG24]|nr:PAS domain S-box protein [Anaerolineales bacterium HSG24]
MNKRKQITVDPDIVSKIAMILGVTYLVSGSFYLYLTLQIQVWQMFTLTGWVSLYSIIYFISAFISRRGQAKLVVKIIMVTLPISMVGVPLLVTDVGLILGLALLGGTIVISGQTLTQKETFRAITIAVIGAVIMALFDLFLPPYRLTVPIFQTFIPFVAGVGLMALLVLIVYQFNSYSIQIKLVSVFVPLGIFSLFAMSVTSNLFIQRTLDDNANQALFSAASRTALELDSFIKHQLHTIQIESQLPAFVDYLNLPQDQRVGTKFEKKVIAVLDILKNYDETFISSYALLDRHGIDVLDTYTADIGVDKSTRDYFQTPMETHTPYVSQARYSDTTGEYAIYFSHPVYNDEGETIGLLRVRYKAAVLQDIVAQSNDLAGEESFAILLDDHHIRLAHGTYPELIWQSVVPLEHEQLAQLKAKKRLPDLPSDELSTNFSDFEAGLSMVESDSPFFTTPLVATDERVASAAVVTLTEHDWLVVFAQSQDVFLAPANTQTQIITFLATVIGFVFAGVTFGMGYFLTKPISNLTETVQRMAEGDLQARATIEHVDEIGQLADVFNTMTQNLQDMIEALQTEIEGHQHAKEELVVNNEELQSTEEKLKQILQEQTIILNNVIVGVAFLKDRKFIWINQKMVSMFGYSMDEMRGISTEKIYPYVENHQRLGVKAYPILAMDKTYQGEWQMKRKDGSLFWCLLSGKAVNPTKLEEGSIWLLEDITERRRAEAALRESEERYRTLFERSNDAIFLVDKQTGRYINANQAAERLTGFSLAEIKTKTTKDLTPARTEQRLGNTKTVETTKEFGEVTYVRADGTERIAILTIIPIGEELIVGIAHDITERKQAMETLRLAKEVAESANQAKTIFISSMSHELRTPLNGILGYAQILERDKSLDDSHKNKLAVIQQSGNHLLNLINDILNFSKMEAERMELFESSFSFIPFVENILAMVKVRANKKNLLLNFEAGPNLPIAIHSDEKRLSQIIINLLNNAIKFTEHGGVTFSVHRRAESGPPALPASAPSQSTHSGIKEEELASPPLGGTEGRAGKIRFQISDTGIGIPQDKLADIFSPFKQVGEEALTIEGTGLGLAISRKLTKLLGGDLHVKSQLGEGSTFWFDLNLDEVEAWQDPQAVKEQNIIGFEGEKRTVLVVDDIIHNQGVLVNILEPLGFEVITAKDGQEGFRKAVEFQPDLVLMDLIMPVMDGFESTQHIKKNLPDTKVIIVSASSSRALVDVQKETGSDDYLQKPVNIPLLLDKIRLHVGLEWIVEDEPPDEAVTPEVMVFPSKSDLMVLYQFAEFHDFAEIETWLTALKTTNEQYIPFINKIEALTETFDGDEICQLIEPHIGE